MLPAAALLVIEELVIWNQKNLECLYIQRAAFTTIENIVLEGDQTNFTTFPSDYDWKILSFFESNKNLTFENKEAK